MVPMLYLPSSSVTGRHSAMVSPPQNCSNMECLIRNFVPGRPHFRAVFIMPLPVFTRLPLFIAANRAYILRSWASDLEANATRVSSKETAGAWVRGGTGMGGRLGGEPG